MTDYIFKTPHGSRLYGFEQTATSDKDEFIVLLKPRQKPIHTVVGDTDTVRIGWVTFMDYALSGSHQSAEALFSPFKSWSQPGEAIKPLFDSLHLGGGEVMLKYERTIRKFAYGDYKRRRHAARLSMALRSIRETGRFNPNLTPSEVWGCEHLASTYANSQLLRMLEVPITLDEEDEDED